MGPVQRSGPLILLALQGCPPPGDGPGPDTSAGVPIPPAVDDCDYDPQARNHDDQDGDGWGDRYDCDDDDPGVHPFGEEVAGGSDEDCDGSSGAHAVPICAAAAASLHGHWKDSTDNGRVAAAADGATGLVAMGMTAYGGYESGAIVGDGLGLPLTEVVFRYGDPWKEFPGWTLAWGRLAGSEDRDLLLAGFSAEVVVAESPFPEEMDPADLPLVLAEEQGFGNQLAATGDVDGDGVDDLLLGQGGLNGQTASVFLGPFDSERERADADWYLTDDVQDPDDWVHPQLVQVGDVDGDGRGDLAFGDTWLEGLSGAVYLVTDTHGAEAALSDSVFHFSGGDSGGEYGNATCTGDFDGDGRLDLVVGGFFAAERAGRVDLVLGPLAGTRSADDSDLALEGEEVDAYLGFSVACGDTNGDDRADLLVGAPGYGTTTRPGLVYLFEDLVGASGPTDADRILSGAHADQELGWSVALADLDGNGRDDIVAGAPGSDVNERNSGSVYMVYSP